MQAEAEEIIHTMGHRMQMPAVRLVGYAIVSVVKVSMSSLNEKVPDLCAKAAYTHRNELLLNAYATMLR